MLIVDRGDLAGPLARTQPRPPRPAQRRLHAMLLEEVYHHAQVDVRDRWGAEMTTGRRKPEPADTDAAPLPVVAAADLPADLDGQPRAAEALRESEAKYRQLFDSASDAVFVLAADTSQIIDANSMASALYGYDHDELLTKKATDMSAEPEETQARTHQAQTRPGQVLTIPLRLHRKKDGAVFPVEITARSFTWGKQAVLLVACRDISERMLAEHRAEERTKELRALYALAEMAQREGLTLDRLYQELTDILPESWQYPEIACARTVIDDREFRTNNFMESAWMQSAPVTVSGSAMGKIDVGYREEMPEEDEGPFLKEERLLIDALAERLGQITERKQAEEDLLVKDRAIETAIDAVAIADQEGILTYVNPAFLKLWGYGSAAEVLGRPATAFWQMGEKAAEVVEALRAQGGWMGELVGQRKDGALFDARVGASMVVDATGQPIRMLASFADITERKQTERLLSVQAEILTILTAPIPVPETVEGIVAALKRATGFDAVGLRFKKGDDYPFLAAVGYSDEFLQAENTLAVQYPDGGLCRNEDGTVNLECTCGLVLGGNTDPASPLFTPGGSAWTNDSLPLLDLPLEEDPRLHPRNRCIHVGFQSIALVPVRAGEEILGLLHLAARRKDRFTAESMLFFEGVGVSIGVALVRKRTEETLARSAGELREQLRDAVKTIGAIVGLRDPYTSAHEQRVTALAAAIAAEMGLGDEAREGLAFAAEVHDIGKIAVPAEILSKPAALTEIEFALIKQHPEAGRELLGAIHFRQPVAEIVAQHHERQDGSGYPAGLRSDEILPEARILAVADVVEAMASHRPYRPALGLDAALAEARSGAGERYDAAAVAACERVFAQGFVFTEP